MSETSVFEMRAMADMSGFIVTADDLIRAEAFDEYPWRDYDRLADAVEAADSMEAVAACLDTNWHTVEEWCDVYGLDAPKHEQSTLPGKLREMDASEVSGD
jgi:hypothetical protein